MHEEQRSAAASGARQGEATYVAAREGNSTSNFRVTTDGSMLMRADKNSIGDRYK